MNFTGIVMQIKGTSVLVKADHDPRLQVWAQLQTDLRKDVIVGSSCRVKTYSGLKIAY